MVDIYWFMDQKEILHILPNLWNLKKCTSEQEVSKSMQHTLTFLKMFCCFFTVKKWTKNVLQRRVHKVKRRGQ